MPLSFQNLYTDNVYVALVLLGAYKCQPGDLYHKIGWWQVEPGATVQVEDSDLRIVQPTYCWFACVGLDGPWWSGDQNFNVTPNKFNQCSHDDSNGCIVPVPFVGATLEPDWFGLTIMLLAPGATGQQNQGCGWAFPVYSNQSPQRGGGPPGEGSSPPWDENPN